MAWLTNLDEADGFRLILEDDESDRIIIGPHTHISVSGIGGCKTCVAFLHDNGAGTASFHELERLEADARAFRAQCADPKKFPPPVNGTAPSRAT